MIAPIDPTLLHTPPPMPPRNWWQRNWKWFVPTGCLTLLLLFALFLGCIVMVVFGAIRSSDAYKVALSRAKESPAVVEALGSPIEEGWFVGGSISFSGSSGNADLSIPISGPKGKARLYAVGAKSGGGEWSYSRLVVEVDDPKQTIDLNAGGVEGF